MSLPGTYKFSELPAREGDRSRFYLATGPGGVVHSRPAQNVLLAMEALLAARIAESEPLAPPVKTVALKKIVSDEDGNLSLAPSVSVTAPCSSESRISGRFAKTELRSGSLIDAVWLGEAFGDVRDEAIYDAALALATEEAGFEGRDLRRLNEQVAKLILARVGIDPDKFLPANL